MKNKKPTQEEKEDHQDSELENVKKRLKKKELQTSILKKIIGQNNPSENKP